MKQGCVDFSAMHLSDTMYFLFSFRKSNPPQNRQSHISTSSSKELVDDFMVELTSKTDE
jgi:hypothetical protein